MSYKWGYTTHPGYAVGIEVNVQPEGKLTFPRNEYFYSKSSYVEWKNISGVFGIVNLTGEVVYFSEKKSKSTWPKLKGANKPAEAAAKLQVVPFNTQLQYDDGIKPLMLMGGTERLILKINDKFNYIATGTFEQACVLLTNNNSSVIQSRVLAANVFTEMPDSVKVKRRVDASNIKRTNMLYYAHDGIANWYDHQFPLKKHSRIREIQKPSRVARLLDTVTGVCKQTPVREYEDNVFDADIMYYKWVQSLEVIENAVVRTHAQANIISWIRNLNLHAAIQLFDYHLTNTASIDANDILRRWKSQVNDLPFNLFVFHYLIANFDHAAVHVKLDEHTMKNFDITQPVTVRESTILGGQVKLRKSKFKLPLHGISNMCQAMVGCSIRGPGLHSMVLYGIEGVFPGFYATLKTINTQMSQYHIDRIWKYVESIKFETAEALTLRGAIDTLVKRNLTLPENEIVKIAQIGVDKQKRDFNKFVEWKLHWLLVEDLPAEHEKSDWIESYCNVSDRSPLSIKVLEEILEDENYTTINDIRLNNKLTTDDEKLVQDFILKNKLSERSRLYGKIGDLRRDHAEFFTTDAKNKEAFDKHIEEFYVMFNKINEKELDPGWYDKMNNTATMLKKELNIIPDRMHFSQNIDQIMKSVNMVHDLILKTKSKMIIGQELDEQNTTQYPRFLGDHEIMRVQLLTPHPNWVYVTEEYEDFKRVCVNKHGGLLIEEVFINHDPSLKLVTSLKLTVELIRGSHTIAPVTARMSVDGVYVETTRTAAATTELAYMVRNFATDQTDTLHSHLQSNPYFTFTSLYTYADGLSDRALIVRVYQSIVQMQHNLNRTDNYIPTDRMQYMRRTYIQEIMCLFVQPYNAGLTTKRPGDELGNIRLKLMKLEDVVSKLQEKFDKPAPVEEDEEESVTPVEIVDTGVKVKVRTNKTLDPIHTSLIKTAIFNTDRTQYHAYSERHHQSFTYSQQGGQLISELFDFYTSVALVPCAYGARTTKPHIIISADDVDMSNLPVSLPDIIVVEFAAIREAYLYMATPTSLVYSTESIDVTTPPDIFTVEHLLNAMII